MTEPVFLTLERTLALHAMQLERWGGLDGVRDMGLLESALAMPSASFGGEYLHGTLFEMAAAYLFHLAKNHPFLDGNKRTATLAAIVFLEINGVEVEADDDAMFDIVLRVANSQASKADLAVFFEKVTK